MNTFVFDIIILFLESLIQITLIRALVNTPWKQMKYPFLLLPINVILSEALVIVFPNLIGWFLSIVLSIIIYKILFSISWENSIIVFAISFCLYTIIEITIVLALPDSMNSINSMTIQLWGNVFVLILAIIISLFIPLNRLFNIIQTCTLPIKLLISDIFLFILIATSLPKQMGLDGLHLLPLITIFALLLLANNILLIKQQQTLAKQQQDLASYSTYQPMLNELIQDIQNKQHDFDNQMNAMKMLPYTHKSYEDLSLALTNYSTHLVQEYNEASLLKINMPVVAGFVFSKIKQAKANNKHLHVVIKNRNLTSKMPEYELIRVLGILIDNAIEAIDDKSIATLHIDSKKEQVIFTTINEGPVVTEEFKKNIFTRGYSSKIHTSNSNNHGYGLNNLLELIKPYHGHVHLGNSEADGKQYIQFEVFI